jgi:hypothetical protein
VKKQAATILLPSTRSVRSVSLPRPKPTAPAKTSPASPTAQPSSPTTIGTVLKIRRETASSALKKTLLSHKLQDKRTPFR